MLVETGCQRALAIALLPEPGEGDDQRAARLRQLAKPANDLVPVHRGQPDVEQDHVGRELPRDPQRRRAVVGHADLMPVQAHRLGERRRGVDVVVDDQHAAVVCARGERADFRLRDALRRAGQEHDEGRTLAGPGAFRAHAAAMQLDEAAHQGEADPEAARRIVLGPGYLHEGLEQALEGLGGNADAGIAHAHLELAVALVGGQLHLASGRRVLDGIGEEVAEDLLQADGIGVDHQRPGRKRDRELLVAGARHGRDGVRRLRQRVAHREPLLLQPDLPPADARDVEELVDDPHHVPRLPFDDGELPLRRARVPLHHLERGDHRRQRIAQLVAEDGEKFVLAPVGILQVPQEPGVVQGDRRLRRDASEQALMLLREVSGSAVDECQAAEEVGGAGGDGHREQAAHGSSVEFGRLHGFDPHRSIGSADAR